MSLFKNVLIYCLDTQHLPNETELLEKLPSQTFKPCGSQELSSEGWVPPCPFTDELLYSQADAWLIALQREERILPTSVIRDAVNEKVTAIQAQESRKVYKKEKDSIKDEIIQDLLPRSFTRRQVTPALILPRQGWILINATSFNRADIVLNTLRECLGSLKVKPLAVNQSPAALMTDWVNREDHEGLPFMLEDEAELRETSEEGGVIKVKASILDTQEIRAHLQTGMQVTRLALNWQDQISFVLHADMRLQRLKLTDQYADTLDHLDQEDAQASFDAELSQFQLDMDRLLPYLIEQFGGALNAD